MHFFFEKSLSKVCHPSVCVFASEFTNEHVVMNALLQCVESLRGLSIPLHLWHGICWRLRVFSTSPSRYRAPAYTTPCMISIIAVFVVELLRIRETWVTDHLPFFLFYRSRLLSDVFDYDLQTVNQICAEPKQMIPPRKLLGSDMTYRGCHVAELHSMLNKEQERQRDDKRRSDFCLVSRNQTTQRSLFSVKPQGNFIE